MADIKRPIKIGDLTREYDETFGVAYYYLDITQWICDVLGSKEESSAISKPIRSTFVIINQMRAKAKLLVASDYAATATTSGLSDRAIEEMANQTIQRSFSKGSFHLVGTNLAIEFENGTGIEITASGTCMLTRKGKKT